MLGLFAYLVCGCGSDRPKLVPASGVIFFDDKPLTSGHIMFQPQRGRGAIADIQADGTFKMSSFSQFDGVTVGQHRVSVSSNAEGGVDEFGEEYAGKSLIPRAYTNFRSSGITVDVPPEGIDNIVIELEKNKK